MGADYVTVNSRKGRAGVLRKAIVATLGIFAFAQAALAQGDYPSKRITVIVPFAPGGGVDLTARIVGDHMSRTLGQQLVIENVGGAGGTLGSARVAKAEPDGYTLLMGNTGTNAAAPALYPQLSYDPAKDFSFIGIAASAPMVLATKAGLPVKTMADFIKLARDNDGKVSSGHAGNGSISHITCILLSHVIGAKLNEIPYRGSGPVMNDILAGQLDSECDLISNVVQHYNMGKVKVLAVAASERSPVLPDVPSAPEAGIPGFISPAWYAMFAPPGLPPAIQEKLAGALQAALDDPQVRKRFEDLGASPPPSRERGPAFLGQFVRDEQRRWTDILKRVGYKPQ